MGWRQTEGLAEFHTGEKTGGVLLSGDFREADLSEYRGKIQCVYIDPPFFTGENFFFRMRVGREGWENSSQTLTMRAYSDSTKGGRQEYLAFLRQAIETAHELLKPTGAFFLHLDCRMDAYARLLCDEIFGEENFQNEIIWAYQTGGRAKNHFSRKHDVILFYGKTKNVFFDAERVSLPREKNRSNHMRRTVDENGRPCRTIRVGEKVYTYYDDDNVAPDDVWTDVSHLQQKDPQRTGYDTQKPQALLDRVIRCCTKEGDWVADFFCGSGTTLVSASRNGCHYLGLDSSAGALSVSRKRLLDTALEVRAPFRTEEAEMDADIQTGLGFYEISLNKYELPRDKVEAGEFHPKNLMLNTLDLVDQWSVGFLKEGVFTAYASEARRKQTPSLSAKLDLPLFRGRVAVEIVDIFGGRTLWVQDEKVAE